MFVRKVKIKGRQWFRCGVMAVAACVLAVADHFGALSYVKNEAIRATVVGARSLTRLSEVVSNIFGNFSGDSEKEIKTLRQELLVYKTEVGELRLFKEENKKLRSILKFSSSIPVENDVIVFANILKVHELLTCNQIYLDRGSKDGLSEGDIVIGESGIVGTIKSLGHRWSQVRKISSVDSYVSVCFLPSRTLTILKGDGNGHLRVYIQENQNTAGIPPGQTAVTDGQDKIFPPGILIGKVNNNKLIVPFCGANPMGIVCVIKRQPPVVIK